MTRIGIKIREAVDQAKQQPEKTVKNILVTALVLGALGLLCVSITFGIKKAIAYDRMMSIPPALDQERAIWQVQVDALERIASKCGGSTVGVMAIAFILNTIWGQRLKRKYRDLSPSVSAENTPASTIRQKTPVHRKQAAEQSSAESNPKSSLFRRKPKPKEFVAFP